MHTIQYIHPDFDFDLIVARSPPRVGEEVLFKKREEERVFIVEKVTRLYEFFNNHYEETKIMVTLKNPKKGKGK